MFVSEIYDECAEILGTTDEKKVYRKIQQAVQSLLESGHWTHATAEVDVCTGWDKCSLALPRGVDIPLAVNIDGSPTYFRNRLFQYHINKGGAYSSVEWAWDDRGYVSTLMDIIQPSQLVAIAEHNNDVGKTIRVLGINQNNHPLNSQLANGTLVDGILVPIHSQQDFAFGTIAPDGITIATRSAKVTPISQFTTAIPHGLSAGQGMLFRVVSGSTPSPLSDGKVYYVGVVDDYTLQLYTDSLNAIAGSYPLSIQSIVGVGLLQLRDNRNSSVVTTLRFPTAPSFAIGSPNEVIFRSGQSLPAPLQSQKTYFVQPIDSQNLNIFSSLIDAQNNANPIYTTGSTSSIDIDVRKEIVPETKLTFSVKHYFNDGDQVQAYTAGGTLPQPLINGQNYYVNLIDDYSVSLHENQADANSSTPTNFVNPIKITTAGVGTNSLVKLIQATSKTGTLSQITAPGLSIATPSGSGAQFQPIVIGSVTSVRVTAGGTGYAVAPNVTFSAPTDLPSGTNVDQRTATGYAVIVSGVVTNVVITDAGYGYTSEPTVTFDSGAASATATITKSFVVGFNKISGGFNYSEAPQVKITGGGGTNATATAVVNTTNLSVSGITRFTTTATATTSTPHGFSTGQTVTISGATPAGYNGNVIVTVPTIDTSVSSITRLLTSTTATITTATNHGYNTGDRVTISGCTGTSAGYNATYNVTVTGANTFTIIVPSTLPNSATGTIVSSIPDYNATTFTYPVSNTLTFPATGTITVFSGEVTSLNIVTQGSGYTTIPTVTITPSTGVFVNFSSTGTLPSPLVSGTAYRAETPLNGLTGTFTVKNTDFSDVNITSGSTGTFYVVLSRAFGVDFTNNWLGDFTSLSTGQQIYFGTDYTLPATSPAIDNGVTPFFLNVASTTKAKAYNTILNANVGGLTGLIDVNSFGTGQSYYQIRTIIAPSTAQNLIKPVNLGYLTEDEIVQFSTSSVLPSPLIASTDYTIKIVGDAIQVYSGGSLVTITTPGTGQLSMNIIRDLSVSASTSIDADTSLYETGDKVTVNAVEGDSLPTGLIAGTSYYVRRIDSNSFELYDTMVNAKNIASITGRKSYTTTGDSVDSSFIVNGQYDPILVKSVSHIDKPLTDGYVSLYAWDYGRSNDMTLIGQYHPTETNPSYRKIRLGKPCAWARIIYKVTSPKITSEYDFIPLEQERAIIAAVHAVDLEDKDFADQAMRYWQLAFSYLKNQQDSIDGHAMSAPQINGLTYGDCGDPVMW